MPDARSIAAAQTIPVRGDVDANVERHLQLVEVAAEEHANALVFPELSLTGYELDLAPYFGFSESDTRLAPLVDAASSASMTLIVGAPAKIESRLYIGAFIISPDRSIELYTKHYLGAFSASDNPDGPVPPPEATFFHAGDRNPLVVVGGNTAAVAVCADTGRPSHPKQAVELGASTYLASMFVIPLHLASDTANLATYAARHSMAVVFANYGGPSGGLPSGGRSAIWSQSGELLCQLDTAGPGVAVAIEHETGWRSRAIMLCDR